MKKKRHDITSINIDKIILFLISNFRRVLKVVCFLLGNSPVDLSEHSVYSIFIGGVGMKDD
jgi:hypothetical protein